MDANSTDIGRVGKLKAGFKQVPIIQIFRNFCNTVMKHKLLKIFS